MAPHRRGQRAQDAFGEVLGVVGTLATPMRPLSSSTKATSVNVPPMSTPIRQAMPSVRPFGSRNCARLTPAIGHRKSETAMSETRRMTRILHRQTGHSYPVAVGGHGVILRDADGKEYIDASRRGGGVVPRPRPSRRARGDARAARPARLCAYELLHDTGGRGAGRRPGRARAAGHSITCIFVSGGSEAVEAALKLARQYFVETRRAAAPHFIARRQSYHGNTLGALAVGGNANGGASSSRRC